MFLAALNNNLEGVAMLLANMSTPFSKDCEGNTIEDVTEHPLILQLI
jgi:hypothetical protein